MDLIETLLFGIAGLMVLAFLLIVCFLFVIYYFVKKLSKNNRHD